MGNRPPVSKPHSREDINDNESITSFLKEEDTGSLIEKMEVLENRTINTEMNISETRGEIGTYFGHFCIFFPFPIYICLNLKIKLFLDILRKQVLSLRKIIDDAGIGNNGNVASNVNVSTARRGSISGTSEGIIAIKQKVTAASEILHAIYTSVVNLVGIIFSLYVSMLVLPFRLVHKWFDYLLALVAVNSTSNGNGTSGAVSKPTSNRSHTRRLSSTGAVVAPGRKNE
jgi:hypothetical protein